MKKYILLILVCVMMAGCNSRDQEEDKLEIDQQTSQNTLEEENPKETKHQSELKSPEYIMKSEEQIFTIYKYYPDTKIYAGIELESKPQNIAEVVDEVANELSIDMPVISITQEKGFVVINLEPEFIDIGKEKLYITQTTLATTLLQNSNSIENIQFQLDGDYSILGGEIFEPATFLLSEGSAEEFKAIREKIPYTKVNTMYAQVNYGMKDDEIAINMSKLLSLSGYLSVDFDDISTIDRSSEQYENLMEYAVTSTYQYTSRPEDYVDYLYDKTLLPIFASVGSKSLYEETLWLENHVEQTAKILYGENFPVEHNTRSKLYIYYKSEGVYTPPHKGGGYNLYAAILDYETTDTGYIAEVAYIADSMGGFFDFSNENAEITEKNIEEYIENTAQRHTITFDKADNQFGMTLKSHKLNK